MPLTHNIPSHLTINVNDNIHTSDSHCDSSYIYPIANEKYCSYHPFTRAVCLILYKIQEIKNHLRHIVHVSR